MQASPLTPSLRRPDIPWLAYLCLAASMSLVGTYVGLSKYLVSVFPIFLLAWLRFGMAAVAMAGWVRPGAGDAPLSRHDRVLLFFESFLGNFLFSIFMLYGVAWSSALAAGVIMAALPGVVAVLSRMFLREALTRRVLAGIACTVTGIALVSMSKGTGDTHGAAVATEAMTHVNGDRVWWGHLFLVGAVFCEASYVVIGKRLTGSIGPKRISALVNLWGLVLVTPFGLWQALSFDFNTVSIPVWGLLVFYALAASMITVWLWMTGLRHVPAARAGVFTVMLPVGAAVIGVWVLHEPLSGTQAGAFGLALLGLGLATWPERTSP